MKYRTEIDGLRSIAVIPVMLFHAGFETFSGGFVGVDVFFVISGFLITSIILGDLDKGRFSIARFYERRIRRILPALLAVVVACMPFAWMWMLPDPLENFGQSVVASVFSANNILLWLTSGYWSLANEFKPLMHTWSLAIEEQYYVVFPIVLVVAWKLGGVRSSLIATAALALLSFAVCQYGVTRYPQANFFLLTSRAWELLAGSICAYITRKRQPTGSDIAALTGLSLIAYAIFAFDESTPFPSAWTLLPVLGTALVLLFARAGTHSARLLSLPPLAFIGLISYSAYLWHQPLFAFARIRSFAEPPMWLMLLLSGAALLLAYFTWRFVETPFRRPEQVGLRTLLGILVPFASAATVFGVAIHVYNGVPSRVFPNTEVASAEAHHAYNMRVLQYKADQFTSSSMIKVLVLGSSFARDFVNAAIESRIFENVELIYRDDRVPACLGDGPIGDDTQSFIDLAGQADWVVFGSSWSTACYEEDVAFLNSLGITNVLFVGTKDFGYNLNAFLRLPFEEREKARSRVSENVWKIYQRERAATDPKRYIDMLGGISDSDGRVRVFTADGMLISPDRRHLTRDGAILIGGFIAKHPALERIRAESLGRGNRIETIECNGLAGIGPDRQI